MTTTTTKQQPEEVEDDLEALVQKKRDFISTLPVDHSYAPVIIREFQGFWAPEASFPGRLIARDLFTSRPSDLVVIANDPCGGAWIKALAFAVLNRKLHHPSAADHPFVSTSPNDLVRFLEWYYLTGRRKELEDLPSPRLFATNSPYTVLPALSGCRIVYLCRELKDAFVSGWKFCSAKRPLGVDSLPIAAALDLFLNGVIASGPAWNHCLEYYQESVRRPENVLFLRYEELMQDLAGSIKKLGEFVGLPFSGEVDEVVVEEMAKLCDFAKLRNINKEVSHPSQDGQQPAEAVGKDVKPFFANRMHFTMENIGCWKDHLTPEMAEKFDEAMKEKLQGSGLTF